MTASITSDDRFQPGAEPLPACPHCGASEKLTAAAVPSFRRLQHDRPGRIGVVMDCGACGSPVFLLYRVRMWRDDRVELQLVPADHEPGPERFSLRYLPGLVARPFTEALACYRHGLWQAFAAMCRQTAAVVFEDVGESGRLRLYDQAGEVQELGQIDDRTFSAVRRVMFDTPAPRGAPEPDISAREAAALLETMKDLLTQTYVRRARLRQALMVRQFFADPPDDDDQAGTPSAGGPESRSASGF